MTRPDPSGDGAPGRPGAVIVDFTAGRRPGGHHEHYLDALKLALAPFGVHVQAPYRDGWSRAGKVPALLQKLGILWRGIAAGRVIVNQYPWPSDVLVLWLVSLLWPRRGARVLYVMRRTPSAELLRHWNYRLADRLMLSLTRRGWLHPISDSRVALEDWQRRAGVRDGSLVAIPPPPDPGREAGGERPAPPGTPTFGLVGALRAEKGAAAYEAVVETALDAFPAAGFHVQLGSPAADRREDVVATLERRWGADPRVRLHEGHLDPADYAGILADCDVVVMPYDVERYGTGTSGVLHEARASGAAVLTTPIAWAVAEYSGDPDVVFLPDTSPERLREGLRAAAARAGERAHRPAGEGTRAFADTWRDAVLRAAAPA